MDKTVSDTVKLWFTQTKPSQVYPSLFSTNFTSSHVLVTRSAAHESPRCTMKGPRPFDTMSCGVHCVDQLQGHGCPGERVLIINV